MKLAGAALLTRNPQTLNTSAASLPLPQINANKWQQCGFYHLFVVDFIPPPHPFLNTFYLSIRMLPSHNNSPCLLDWGILQNHSIPHPLLTLLPHVDIDEMYTALCESVDDNGCPFIVGAKQNAQRPDSK
jgi:hypothetical protein